MTKLSQIIFLLIGISFINAACNHSAKRYQYKGFQNVIDINNIKSISGKSEAKVLNINIPAAGKMSFNYNKNLKDTYFIKLENKEGSTINNIDKILLTKDRIIVVDLKITPGVYFFDSAGHFISSIIAGNGVIDKKMMISNFLDVAYDYSTDELILHDQNKSKMYYFDKDGHFKNSTKEYIYFENFVNVPHTDIFVYLNVMGGNEHIPALDKSTIYIGEKDTHIKYTATAAVKQMRPNVNYSINRNPSITNSNENLFYTPEFCDTVYQMKGKPLNIYPRVVIHYPGTDLNSTLKATHKDDITNFNKLINTGQFYAFQGEIMSTNDGIYYMSVFKDKLYGYFYSEKTNKIIGGDLSYKGLPIDTVNTDVYKYPFTTFNNYFVTVLSSKDFNKPSPYQSEKLAEFKKGLKPGQNPVLFFYKLKGF